MGYIYYGQGMHFSVLNRCNIHTRLYVNRIKQLFARHNVSFDEVLRQLTSNFGWRKMDMVVL